MDQLLALAEKRFILLTTYRRSGEAVSTPVWVGREGEALVVLTPARSGKVRRLRRDPRVQVQPCGRIGKVPAGVEPIAATAEVREDLSMLNGPEPPSAGPIPSSPASFWVLSDFLSDFAVDPRPSASPCTSLTSRGPRQHGCNNLLHGLR